MRFRVPKKEKTMDLFSPGHLLLILVIILILFGGKKIPEVMKGLGEGIREFKKAKDDPGPDTAKKELKDPSSGNPKT
jgi:sec-independent protein translocase protein TatA